MRERYRAKRDVLLPALEALGLRSAGGDATFFLWLEGSRRRSPPSGSSAGVVVAPGSFFGPAGEGYLRLALVPPLEIEHASAARGDHQSFACSAALSPAQRPERGSASTVPVLELRRNSSPFAPLSSRALTDVAVRQRDERARGDVEPGLDRAVVAERDADARVGAEQAALADRDHLAAAAGQRAHDRRAAADVRAVADDDARR